MTTKPGACIEDIKVTVNGEHEGEAHDLMQQLNSMLQDLDLEKLHSTDLLPQNHEGFKETEDFLLAIVGVLLKYVRDVNDRKQKLLEFHHPGEMKKLFDFQIPDTPVTLQQLVKDCEDTLKYGVKTGHPRFFNQISCGLDIVSLAGEWLTAVANTNMFTYEIAPVFILMERELMKKMWQQIGWEDADGIFAPGGSVSNLYAVLAARHHVFPRSKPLGVSSIPQLAMFTSEDSHYSVKGAAATSGIGTDNCFLVEVDGKGRMIPEALEQKILEAKHQNLHPFFVCATAGTTVYGAFDPIHAIADICEKHGLWLHVDAAWGGGLLMSERHRHLLAGVERAQSVTWNPHKLMGAHLQCSACIIRQDGLLFQCNQMSADYLFQQDKPYDCSFDTGDKAIQCGRHNDIFKLWLMWRGKGSQGFEKQINRLMDLSAYFTERIKNTPGYEMVVEEPEYLNICFWYVTPKLRELDDPAEKKARLEKIAPKIKAKMMNSGTTMVGYQPDKQRPNFFRMIISNPAITREDLDFLIHQIVEFGKDL